MMNERLYLDVHVLQTVPPSCVNRDDTGSPKTAVYGGVTRARVSSQSWKHAMRLMFRDELPPQSLGVRTKRIVAMVADAIAKMDANADAESLANKVLTAANLNILSAEEGTGALFFMSRAQANALARLILENPAASKAQAQKALKDAPGLDIALFGRMVAGDKSLNIDACAQVAHSLSTHKASNEYDFFTAVDDDSSVDSAAAGHLGTVEFNSSTLYRYATIAVHELNRHLVQGTAQAVRVFVDAFVRSMPTGRQNTFANRTLPEAVLVCLREDQPVNLVGAFERAVKGGEGGYAEPSVKRLVEYARGVYEDFVDQPAVCFAAGHGLEGLCEPRPFKDLLSSLEKEIARRTAWDEERA